jgi:hypothetical protein
VPPTIRDTVIRLVQISGRFNLPVGEEFRAELIDADLSMARAVGSLSGEHHAMLNSKIVQTCDRESRRQPR